MTDPRPAWQRHLPLAGALAILLLHFATFDVRGQALVTDIRYYVYFAWQMTEGGVPHVDFFDNKTQLASFAGAFFHFLGDLVGADPLTALRLGYMGITAAGGWLLYLIMRRLGAAPVAAGLLGVLAWCSFGLLGVFASIGNSPKLLMAVSASAVALLVDRRRWFWAGVFGALSFMDWQIGALAWLAAFVPACIYGKPRGRAILWTLLGGFAGMLPFVLYYALNGALWATFEQTILASLFRGSSGVSGGSSWGRLFALVTLVRLACPQQGWVFYSGAAGLGILPWWWWHRRGKPEHALLTSLALYHFGLLAFSLLDFQWYGDFFSLLPTAAFFLAVTWVAAHDKLLEWIRALAGEGSARFVPVFAILMAVVLARPGPLRPPIDVRGATVVPPGVTLQDQQALADAVGRQVEGKTIAFLEHSELLYLMRRKNSLPVIYWNRPTWFTYRLSEDEGYMEASIRLLRSVEPDAVVFPYPRRKRIFNSQKGDYESRLLHYTKFIRDRPAATFVAPDGRYGVRVMQGAPEIGTPAEEAHGE